jgi:hypothetical protein
MSSNFICISNYNNDLDWVKDFSNPHIIYDKTWNGGYYRNDSDEQFGPSKAKEKWPDYNIVNGDPNGYNISDYMTFIVDNYDNLPDVTVFCKGNTFPRHVTREKFESLVNLKCFAPIEEWRVHNSPSMPIAMFSCDGGWMEINNSWYLNHPQHPTKYFSNYNHFLSFCFEDPVLPKYTRFPPGGNFIVPKQYILKYDKIFYQNLKTIVSHSRVPGEGQLVERALFTIWMCNWEVSENMKVLID